MTFMLNLFFIAQTTQPAQPAQPVQTPGLDPTIFIGLMLAIIVFYVFLFGGQRKKQKKMEQMIAQIKKNDRIVTIGGIVGTVVSAKDDEIVVKIDETTNTKMTFVRKAIQRVISEQPQS